MPALLAGARCAGQFLHRGLAALIAAPLQLKQHCLHRGRVGKAVPALAIGAQLGGGLRAAQHQQANHHGLRFGGAGGALKVVFVARHAAGAALKDQALCFQAGNGGARFIVIDLHQGVAAGFLVAARHECVQAQGITVGHGAGFFHECAQHAGFNGGQDSDGHKLEGSI